MCNERVSLIPNSCVVFGEHCSMILLCWPWKHHFWSITIPLNQPTKCHVPVNTNVMVTLSAEEIYRSVTQSFQGTPDTEHPQDACTKPTNRLWEGREICLTGYKYHIVHTAFCVVSLSQSQRYTIISHGLCARTGQSFWQIFNTERGWPFPGNMERLCLLKTAEDQETP